jgi:3-oxoacyl-[acyl-carrier-protein] synthase-3
MNSRIIGTGSHLPEKVLTNADLEKIVDTSDEWIRSRTGICSRHIAAEGELTSDLALPAAQKALQSAGVAAGEIDMIIVATTTPDMIFPSTACILQTRLGIAGCPAFDLQAVCSGFVYALSMADLFIRDSQAKKVLVVGAEVYSRILDWNDRSTCVLFGDGAGAVVLAASDTPGILATRLHADGSYKDKLSVPGSVCGGKVWGSPFVHGHPFIRG